MYSCIVYVQLSLTIYNKGLKRLNLSSFRNPGHVLDRTSTDFVVHVPVGCGCKNGLILSVISCMTDNEPLAWGTAPGDVS